MNKHWPTAPRCGHQPSSASLLLAAWADEQAAPAAAQGNLDAKQKSPQLGLHMQPGSSCLRRRWWHHAKYPWPLHRSVMIITIPPVPSGECLSPQNMWHFTDTITGMVATRLWGEKAPAGLLHALWAHTEGGRAVRKGGEVEETHILFLQMERQQRQVSEAPSPSVELREWPRVSYWPGHNWAFLRAWVRLSYLGWCSCMYLQSQGLGFVYETPWIKKTPTHWQLLDGGKRKIKLHRPRVLTS